MEGNYFIKLCKSAIVVLFFLPLLIVVSCKKEKETQELIELMREQDKLVFEQERMLFIKKIDSLTIVSNMLHVEDESLREELAMLREELEEMSNSLASIQYNFEANASRKIRALKLDYERKIRVLKADVVKIKEQKIENDRITDSIRIATTTNKIDSLVAVQNDKIAPPVIKRKTKPKKSTVEIKSSNKKNEAFIRHFSKVHIIAKPIRKLNDGGRIAFVKTAKRTTGIQVCYTIEQHDKHKPGNYKLYLQILDPKGTVIGDSYVVDTGKKSTHITEVLSFKYENKTFEECKVIYLNKYKTFHKGIYKVNILNNEGMLATSDIKLK